MHAILITALAVSVPSFLVGAIYGRQEEAKAIALFLRLKSVVSEDYRKIIVDIEKAPSSLSARLKKLL